MLLFGKREFLRPFLSTGCRMTQVESHSEGIAPPFLSMLISLKHKTWLQHQILLWCFFFSSHTPCISFFPACSYSYRPGQALMLITESILGYLEISSAKKKNNSTNLFWHILRTRIKGKHVFFFPEIMWMFSRPVTNSLLKPFITGSEQCVHGYQHYHLSCFFWNGFYCVHFFFLVQSPNGFHISAATIMVVPVIALAHALAMILSQSLFYCHDKKTIIKLTYKR